MEKIVNYTMKRGGGGDQTIVTRDLFVGWSQLDEQMLHSTKNSIHRNLQLQYADASVTHVDINFYDVCDQI